MDETYNYEGLQMFPDRHPAYGSIPYKSVVWRQNSELITLNINVKHINRYEFTITKDTFSFNSVYSGFHNVLKFRFYDTVQAVSHEIMNTNVLVYFVKTNGVYWPKLTRDDGFVGMLPLCLIQSPVPEHVLKKDKFFLPVGDEEQYVEKLCRH